jgi:hypothetical protein
VSQATSLVQERLTVSPQDPRLWCSLGDLTLDDACYTKAWEVSGRRHARAQRSLAKSAQVSTAGLSQTDRELVYMWSHR